MMKVKIFLGIFILGLISTILSFIALGFDYMPERYHIILPMISAYVTVGGAIGACVYSKKAREFFGSLIRDFLEYF